ncbi:MAG TPA: DUF885 domain-containing protein [Acidimicrobiales bacterium]|nr:DUF885 domain-containing protein [Acidimicrobiales bacterium]
MAADFEALVDEWIKKELEESPIRASSLGIDGYDDLLGDYSTAGFERRDRADDDWLKRLHDVDESTLSFEQRIDLGLLRSTVTGRKINQTWLGWRRDPGMYANVGLQGVFALFLHRVHEEADLARFAIARMQALSGVLEDGKKNIDPDLVPPLFVERAAGPCRAGIGYFRNLVPQEIADDKLRRELAEAGDAAATALESYLGWLDELAPKAKGDWVFGETRYSALLQEKEVLAFNTEGLNGLGHSAFDTVERELNEVAARLDASSDWRTINKRLTEDHPPSPDDMRAAYEACTAKARQFLIDHELVTLATGEQCLVEPSPPFQRPVLAVASYATPPAFKPTLTGHFFVPFPPDGTSEAEVQQRLATNSFHMIPTITAHEAYPGHHWHLTWMQGNERRLRKMHTTPYFSEGWGLYAERVMYEHGFFTSDEEVLGHLDARIFRAARIIVDTSLHTGEMSPDDAVKFMTSNTALSEATAVAEVKRYCAWPTQAASYLTGCLEIERIRQQFLDANRGTLRDFHDRLAGAGALPIGLAERAVLAGAEDEDA